MTVLVEGKGLRFHVGDAVLVDEVDIEVEGGDLVAVIGPNGAGKSMLLTLLAGDAKPGAGTIRVAGRDPAAADHGEMALLRAVLPQRRVADIPFSAREVVRMARYPHRRVDGNSRATDEAAIASAMERTATEQLGDRIFATLSGGEQERVALARVLAQETPVLLLDEPTAALDVAHEQRVMQELTARAAAGSAVLAVLHDLNAAARYATRIVVLADGRVAAEGSPASVLTDALLSRIYRHPMRVVPHPFRNCPLVLTADDESSEAHT